jgi:uncharacterized protein YbjT (DUF2867 family)
MSEKSRAPEPVQLVLVGATGMVGRQVMERGVGRHDVRIAALARREVPLPPGARMEMLVADPAHWGEALRAAAPQVVVIALGTTIRAVGGDRAAFRAVDHDLVIEVAQAAKAAGVPHVIAVSSVGAASGASNFYLSVKGETEDALARLHFDRLDLIRPGLLLGKREGPLRLGEKIAMALSPVLSPLLMGKWRQYRSIRAKTVAEVILALAQLKVRGRFVHDYDSMQRVLHTARRNRGE